MVPVIPLSQKSLPAGRQGRGRRDLFLHWYWLENNSTIPSLPAGEGKGEHAMATPTSILPHRGGGNYLVIFMVLRVPSGHGVLV
jgi:hypothetical protein